MHKSLLSRGFVHVIWGFNVVRAAINLDGSPAVNPVTDDDPSPIADINTYHPDQHDCPPSCVDYANTHSWIPFFSVDRLARCREPLLLQFSVSEPLDSPSSTILIRSCSVASNSSSLSGAVENPKKDTTLFHGGRLATAPACIVKGFHVNDTMQIGVSRAQTDDDQTRARAVTLLRGMERFFQAEDNCDEKFLFAYHQQTVASLYIGAGLGKTTATSSLKALANHIENGNAVSNQTVVELCGHGREPARVFGIAVENTGNLAAVQDKALQWSHGKSAIQADINLSAMLHGASVFDIAGVKDASGGIHVAPTPTLSAVASPEKTRPLLSRFIDTTKSKVLDKRAVCRHIPVEEGDSCTSLSVRCGIRGAEFLKYNPQKGLCSSLARGDHVCCSAGEAYKPSSPKPQADGTCATHFIDNGDSCSALAKKFGVSVKDIESWNKKTWAWTDCSNLLLGYNMCISPGKPPMPPAQKGTECGPLVPGTKLPKDSSISLADLNPCPLKACCSNWGFCGVFPGHCKDNSPANGGPGSTKKGSQSTCVSNCGTNIKENSGRPKEYGRIGYYEAFNTERDCLWLKAKNANTDGSYTHIHWAFASIDSSTWKPVIKQGAYEWEDFKKLKTKRIVSLGGWADSTAPDKYQVIRSAIISNRVTFATNLAKFVEDEGLDGVDIDWEYPGASDILAGGKPIGEKSDGLNYLRFLTVLREKLGSDKSLSIAAPASYWYLKAFPIDKMAEVLDYIVFMTYDLHGQWDYGNPNAYDSCESGKCIRSHVNMTETRNSLSMITKAGVPNNKVFVGEASYGRSFHMAKDGCWKPTCEFTGSRAKSDAKPGRCTAEGGYLAYAEILEILMSGKGTRTFYDESSESDILLYNGDYVSYLDPQSKEERRVIWKDFNFGGTIDWAVDLQRFTSDDFEAPPDIPKNGHGCIEGEDVFLDTEDLCWFSCAYGFCPPSKCECTRKGPLKKLPSKTTKDTVLAEDEFDVDVNRLCKFSCKYGYCPLGVCRIVETNDDTDKAPDGIVTVPPDYDEDSVKNRDHNDKQCYIYKQRNPNEDKGLESCKKQCQEVLDEAAEEGRISNYGCVSMRPLDSPIIWQKQIGSGLDIIGGQCSCDNWFLNELAEWFIDALPAIAQLGCYLIMSTVKLLFDVGTSFVAPGRALGAGAEMILYAVDLINYVYPADEDPVGAFEWWLSPCGGSDLVPDDIKEVFDWLSAIPTGRSRFKPPKKIKKGSGKKGDAGNPRSAPGPQKPPTGTGSGSNPKPKKKCKVSAKQATQRLGGGKNTLRLVGCDPNDVKTTTNLIVTTLTYAPNAAATHYTGTCKLGWSQACYHYSSAQSNNPHWSTLDCPQAAATNSYRNDAAATATWNLEHKGSGWTDATNYKVACDRDEFPPAYLLAETDDAFTEAGRSRKGQRLRFIPGPDNRRAGSMWKGVCFARPLEDLSLKSFHDLVTGGTKGPMGQAGNTRSGQVAAIIQNRPRFEIAYEIDDPKVQTTPKLKDDGLWDNACWPKHMAKTDPGFVLLSLDEWYDKNPKPVWDYTQAYKKGSNGD